MQNRYLSSRNPAPLPTGLLATRRWCGWLSCVISRHVHRYWNTRYSKLSQGRRLQKNGAPWALCPLQLFSFSSSIIWRRYSSKGQTKRTARKGLLVLPVALFVFFFCLPLIGQMQEVWIQACKWAVCTSEATPWSCIFRVRQDQQSIE